MRVYRSRCSRRPRLTADGEKLVSPAGAGLPAEMADRSGLTGALSEAMAGCGISWRAHDPGVVVSHLAVAIADGADCLSDLATLREQPELSGPVASQATAWRAIEAVTAPELRGIATAAGVARQRVWSAAGARRWSRSTLTATLVTAHSEKDDAAATYRRGFGFHPVGGVVGRDRGAARCDAPAGQRGSEQRNRSRAFAGRGYRRLARRLPGRSRAGR